MNAFRGTTGVLVLLSGGVDSVVLAVMAQRKRQLKACLFIGYNQAAQQQELRAAKRWCDTNDVLFIFARVDIPIITMNVGAGKAGPRFVPMRNATLLSMAVAHAVELGCNEVHYGAIADDQADYPDCRPSWILDFNRLSMDGAGVKVRAPLVAKGKAQVMALATGMGIDLDACWSCYEPDDGEPCGECNSCRGRK